jgi:outer membrane translocation and assembly module TamA
MLTPFRALALALALSASSAACLAQVPDLAPAPGQPTPAAKPAPAEKPAAPPAAKPEPKSSRRQLKAAQQPATTPAATAPAAAPAAEAPVFAKQYIHSIAFKGAEPYTASDLLPLSGLKPGQLLAPDSLQLATQRLADSGLFSDAQATNDGDTGMRDITFTLKPVPDDALLHLSFSNFIWLSDRDLQASIRRLVPILHVGLPDPRQSPVAKSICDDVKAGLVKLLLGRGVVATVAYDLVPPNQFHPYRSIEFNVTDPVVRLESAEITNYPNTLIDQVNAAIARARVTTYNEGIAGVTIEDLLLTPARNLGYVNAKLYKEQRFHRIINQHEVTVQYSAQLLVGPLFHIRSIRYDSTPVYSSSDYGRDRKVQPGDVATTASLDAARQPILDAYLAQGYLEAFVDTRMTLDEAHGTVDLSSSVVPGEIYRVGKVIVTGLAPDAKAEFDRAWKLNPGVVYSDHYVSNFTTANRSLTKLAAYTYAYHVDGDRQTHLATLTINFRPRTTTK